MVLIVIVLVVGLILAASVALGRSAYEVESARDTEYLDLEGNWVRYNVMGGGPPVVLVHGWLSSSRVWEGLAGRLAQRFTVYTLDLPGFGESDKPLSGYGVRYGSRLLYAFCAHFGLTRASVIGHDIGGDMAVKLAADHPDVVGRLVLVSTPANEDQIDLPTPLWLATLPVIGPLFYGLGKALRPLRTMWMRPFFSDPDDLTEDAVEDAAMSTPAAMSASLGMTRREISGGRLARQARIIKVPILLVAGEEDQIVDPQAVGVWARSAEQAEVVLMDGCGHMPMIERPAEFNAQILAFLTGDARYLDYVEEPRATDDEEPDVDENLEYAAENEEREGEGRPPVAQTDAGDTTPGGPTVFPVRGEDEPPDRAERTKADDASGTLDGRTGEEPPTVHRKRGGRYPAKGEDAGAEAVSDNGTEERVFPREEPREARREPRREQRERPRERYDDVFERESSAGGGEKTGKGEIPEVPEDLFSWPEPRRDFRRRDRSPESSPDGDEDPDGPGPLPPR
jgi:pimeloyl-ACP methyl ester carboxylesterase